MIRRRAAAGIATKLGNHSFRATGITAYLKNGGTLEKAAAMANHASTRTRQLYDRHLGDTADYHGEDRRGLTLRSMSTAGRGGSRRFLSGDPLFARQ